MDTTEVKELMIRNTRIELYKMHAYVCYVDYVGYIRKEHKKTDTEWADMDLQSRIEHKELVRGKVAAAARRPWIFEPVFEGSPQLTNPLDNYGDLPKPWNSSSPFGAREEPACGFPSFQKLIERTPPGEFRSPDEQDEIMYEFDETYIAYKSILALIDCTLAEIKEKFKFTSGWKDYPKFSGIEIRLLKGLGYTVKRKTRTRTVYLDRSRGDVYGMGGKQVTKHEFKTKITIN